MQDATRASKSAPPPEEAAKTNRFELLKLFLTALFAAATALAVAWFTAKQQLQNTLSERRFATSRDLTNFLAQQSITLTNFAVQQDLQFSLWLKQQKVLAEKRTQESAADRQEWLARQDTLIRQKLAEIRAEHEVAQSYWEGQQYFSFLKDHLAEQREFLDNLDLDMRAFESTWAAAVQKALENELFFRGHEKRVAWFGKIAPVQKTGLEYEHLQVEWEKSKSRLRTRIDSITWTFPRTAIAPSFTNALAALASQELLALAEPQVRSNLTAMLQAQPNNQMAAHKLNELFQQNESSNALRLLIPLQNLKLDLVREAAACFFEQYPNLLGSNAFRPGQVRPIAPSQRWVYTNGYFQSAGPFPEDSRAAKPHTK